MTVKKTDKDQLLDNASYLFRIKGYHNTSISDIAQACNLSKGSVYHYITSKKELGVAVIKRAHRLFQEKIFSISTQHAASPTEGLQKMFSETEAFFSAQEGGSLIGNLAHEVTETVPEFVELFKEFYSDWINAITKLLSTKLPAEKARMLAEDSISQLQGALMLSRLYKDQSALKRVGQQLVKEVE